MDGDKTVTAHFVPVGVPTCVTIQRGTLGEVADGFIWQARPTEGNFGAADFRSPTSAVDRYISSEYSSVSRRPWLEVCYVAP